MAVLLFIDGDNMATRLALLASCLVATTAVAADNGVYLGLSAERSDFNLDGATSNKDNGLKVIAGVRLLDSFGVELNYADHGKATLPSGIACMALAGANCPDTSKVAAKTTAAYAVGFIDFPLLDIFAKAGLARMDGALTTPGQPAFHYSDKDTDLALGLGAQAHFGSLGARVEMEQFKLFGKKLRTLSASFVYTFL